MSKEKVIYYKDELNDDFAEAKIQPRIIDENYKYEHNIAWNICSYILQNILSMPIKYIYQKCMLKQKYIGREKLKECKKRGYFIYANHTQPFADTFMTSVAIYPKRNFLLVNPINISLKGTGTIVEMLGAIPVPGNVQATKNFLNTINKKIEKGSTITIYPEAHIWPYYTKIRPFKDVSFKYPIKLNTPVFCMTNTYQRCGKNMDKVRVISYIDGPFFPDTNLGVKERQKDLRDRVYNKMVERSYNSNIEHIKYIKEESNLQQ